MDRQMVDRDLQCDMHDWRPTVSKSKNNVYIIVARLRILLLDDTVLSFKSLVNFLWVFLQYLLIKAIDNIYSYCGSDMQISDGELKAEIARWRQKCSGIDPNDVNPRFYPGV